MPLSIIAECFESSHLQPDRFPSGWVIEGSPQIKSKFIAASADGGSRIVAWSCSPGRFHWNYAADETLHVLKGYVRVTDDFGQSIYLRPGVTAFFQKGTRTIWHVYETVEKIAVCRDAMPRPLARAIRAWNRLNNRLTGINRVKGQETSSGFGIG